MIALMTFFLVALMLSIIAVWMYRLIATWKGFNQMTVSRSGSGIKGWFQAQQTFSPATSSNRGNPKYMATPNTRSGIKTPWGW